MLRNRRVIKQHHYVWDRLSLLHDVELDAAGSQQAITTYLFEEHDQSIPLGHQRDGAWHYYLHEPNGAPQDVVDGAGGLLLSMRRGAFGRVPTNGNSAASTDVRFWGQRADEETGLHYNRYRYYDPDTGRFTSPDPIGLDGGPNLYGYAPNPIGWADPMGWSHVMNHHGPSEVPGASSDTQSSTHGDSGRYESGWANGNPCPSLLRDNGTDRSLANRANCHTEQKFAADLLASHRADNDHSNDTHNLSGSLPPCPTCHTALRRAAAETGANISYSFGDPPNRISYNGGSAGGNPLAVAADASDYSGADAGRLASGGYTGGRTNSRSTWGYSPGSGASSTYSSVRSSYP